MQPGNQQAFEQQAELLVAHQLDLLAQLEKQIRGVHNTLKQIEKLRSPKHRAGPELTDAQRGKILTSLASELDVIDRELQTQHESCGEMQTCITHMRQRLGELRPRAAGAERA